MCECTQQQPRIGEQRHKSNAARADDELVVAAVMIAQSTHIVRHYGNGQFAPGNMRYYNVIL